MNSLSTHILDTANGRPAADVALYLLDTEGTLLFAGVTNADGRCPDLPNVQRGRYRLAFEVGAYFRNCGTELPDPPFLGTVVIDFGVAEGGSHYHVPLLVSPFGYSTYRGS